MTVIKNKPFIIFLLILTLGLIIAFCGLQRVAFSGGEGGDAGNSDDCPEALGPEGEFGGFDSSQGSSNSSNSDSGNGDGNGDGWDFPNEPPPPPPTVTLTTWPTFTLPEPVSLYWSSTNADSCVASGDWSGSKTIQGEEHFSKPRGDYIFTLTCTGPGGSAFDTKNVKVIQVPQCSFTANPTSIILPASSTLSWSCEYADACSIDQGIGSVNPVSGTKSVRPSQTTTYTLTCSSLDGSRSYPATVNVGFEPTRREVPPR